MTLRDAFDVFLVLWVVIAALRLSYFGKQIKVLQYQVNLLAWSKGPKDNARDSKEDSVIDRAIADYAAGLKISGLTDQEIGDRLGITAQEVSSLVSGSGSQPERPMPSVPFKLN